MNYSNFLVLIRLSDYDAVVLNSSGGKDSLAMIIEVHKIAVDQKYPLSKIIVSHQDMGESEWPGTGELVKQQCEFFGLRLEVTRKKKPSVLRKIQGIYDSLLEYAVRRGRWPSSKRRWCTSDFKRNEGAKIVTGLSRWTFPWQNHKILYCFGFRADESPARAKVRHGRKGKYFL